MSTEKLNLTKAGGDKGQQAVAFKANWNADKRVIESDDFVANQHGTSYSNYQASLIHQLKQTVKEVESLRTGNDKDACMDISFGDYVQEKFGISKDKKGGFAGLMNFLGLDTGSTTIQRLMTMPSFNEDFTWLVPELVRDAIRTGFLNNPIWESLIASDTNVSAASIKIPQIKKASTPMYRLNEAETIPFGNMTFGEKTITMFKVGTGIEISDEVRQYVSVDVLSEYLGSAGVTLSQGLSTAAARTLVNGDGNSNAASVIGVEALNAFDYDNDLLRVILRMGILGYNVDSILSNEEPARKIMSLPEFKGFAGDKTLGGATFETGMGVPNQFKIYPSGVMPVANQIMLLDTMKALHKYTSRALLVESDRLITSQVTQTVATITTGFSKFMRDASIIVDKSILFSGNGFPSYMNPTADMVYDWENN